jgi:hypothetical protein
MLSSCKTFVQKVEEQAAGDQQQLATGWKVAAFKLFIQNYKVCSAPPRCAEPHSTPLPVARL